MFLKEHKLGMYRTDVYFLSKTLAEVGISSLSNYTFLEYFCVAERTYEQGWTGMWFYLCLRNSLKIATRICQFSQYLGTKLEMLFEIAKCVEMVIILGKTGILP